MDVINNWLPLNLISISKCNPEKGHVRASWMYLFELSRYVCRFLFAVFLRNYVNVWLCYSQSACFFMDLCKVCYKISHKVRVLNNRWTKIHHFNLLTIFISFSNNPHLKIMNERVNSMIDIRFSVKYWRNFQVDYCKDIIGFILSYLQPTLCSYELSHHIHNKC
jgi:hypothetical protein